MAKVKKIEKLKTKVIVLNSNRVNPDGIWESDVQRLINSGKNKKFYSAFSKWKVIYKDVKDGQLYFQGGLSLGERGNGLTKASAIKRSKAKRDKRIRESIKINTRR